MLILLRILLAPALVYGFWKAWQNAQDFPESGDLANAFYAAYCVLVGLANAIVWAPFIGGKLGCALSGELTSAAPRPTRNPLLWLIYRLNRGGHRRATCLMCFLEGIQHPSQPGAFIIGLANAREGSWLEKVYAREVWRFKNAQDCLQAYHALRRHGIDPRPHRDPQVNGLLTMTLARETKPAPKRIRVPETQEAPPLKRNPKIRIFDDASADSPAPNAPNQTPPTH